ncbi:MAG: hypothetical protein ACHQK9_17875, partial [Reyranellales bacterium]
MTVPGMPATRTVAYATVGLLWALALWHAWECRGLYGDGAYFLVKVLERGQLFDELASRRHVTAVVQFPLLSGLWLGVSDLRWLARLFSLGMMGAPT